MAMLLSVIALIAPQHEAEMAKQLEMQKRHVAVARSRAHVQYDPRLRVVRPFWSRFMRIAACESGQRWYIATGNGFYGGIQFTLQSWHAVGGRGYPHQNSRLEQVYRGVRLMRVQGWNAWPRCQYAR